MLLGLWIEASRSCVDELNAECAGFARCLTSAVFLKACYYPKIELVFLLNSNFLQSQLIGKYKDSMSSSRLLDIIAEKLPKDFSLSVRHVSSIPTICEALFSAPPNEKAETTYLESHFFSISINNASTNENEVIAFAFEVLIYSTERLTTLFVSKADSTGHLHLLGLPKGSPSLIKDIFTAFLSNLIREVKRSDVPIVLSLFARAQNQYLFPGSIENTSKHVLDDRGLVKWWCRVVDPILTDRDTLESATSADSYSAKAYLIVPGCDKYETKGFFPPSARYATGTDIKWQNAHPLYQIAKFPAAPPRCLVPRFPDDPKSRFLTDLDTELPENRKTDSPSKHAKPGHWHSVKTLEQFWELMSFRQECSAGRLVGFLWVVVADTEDIELRAGELVETAKSDPLPVKAIVPDEIVTSLSTSMPAPTPDTTSASSIEANPPTHEGLANSSENQSSENQGGGEDTNEAEFSALAASEGKEDTPDTTAQLAAPDPPEKTRYYFWPQSTRGNVVLNSDDYSTVVEYLDDADFAGVELAAESTKKWAVKVSEVSGCQDWEQVVVGRKVVSDASSLDGSETTPLNTLLVRKRKKDEGADVNGADVKPATLLQVRKKKKPTQDAAAANS